MLSGVEVCTLGGFWRVSGTGFKAGFEFGLLGPEYSGTGFKGGSGFRC